jgi:hypothetical protein
MPYRDVAVLMPTDSGPGCWVRQRGLRAVPDRLLVQQS